MTLRSLSLFLFLCAAVVPTGCTTETAIQRSYDHARLGDYGHAFEIIEAERQRQLEQAGEVGDEVARLYEQRRREFLLWRARERIFGEREDDALADLELLAEVDPDYPGLARLRDRALRKKASRIVAVADESLAERELVAAMEGYLEAQRLVPDFPAAAEGVDRVREETARLGERAQQQFLQAVRKVPEFRYVEVEWHAANVIHNEPDREDAKDLREAARRENAQSVFERGRECERQNQFGAALVLYKAARDIDPELAEVDEAIDEMKVELEAVGMLERAQLKMRNSEYEEARELLSGAFEMSKLSRGAISELMIQSRRREAEERYQAARDFEVMGKKAEALAAFEALSKDWPDGLEDEQARIAGLRVDIEGAETEWAAAEAAEAEGDLRAALDHYIDAERYYAEWRDGERHIERLEQLIAEQEAEEAGGENPAGASGEKPVEAPANAPANAPGGGDGG